MYYFLLRISCLHLYGAGGLTVPHGFIYFRSESWEVRILIVLQRFLLVSLVSLPSTLYKDFLMYILRLATVMAFQT
jgi:hypothetical protein